MQIQLKSMHLISLLYAAKTQTQLNFDLLVLPKQNSNAESLFIERHSGSPSFFVLFFFFCQGAHTHPYILTLFRNVSDFDQRQMNREMPLQLANKEHKAVGLAGRSTRLATLPTKVLTVINYCRPIHDSGDTTGVGTVFLELSWIGVVRRK